MILKVANKWQPNPPALVGNNPKLGAVVDRKFHNDMYSASIFSKVIGHKLSNGYNGDLYLRCRIKFSVHVVQTQIPHFVDMDFLTINKLDKSSGISNTATKIQRPTYGSNWSAPNHIFGEATSVLMSEVKSYHDYNYKTKFQICK